MTSLASYLLTRAERLETKNPHVLANGALKKFGWNLRCDDAVMKIIPMDVSSIVTVLIDLYWWLATCAALTTLIPLQWIGSFR